MHLEKQSIYLLIAISVAAFMDGLDASIVNVALPAIAETYSTDTGTVSWVSLASFLMVAGTILIFGNIASRGHLKKTFIIGFALFGGASALCVFAPSLGFLIAARILQGLGVAMLAACVPVTCVSILPTKILGLSFGILSAATAIGYIIGPVLGGILIYTLSWHWIFLINVPIALGAIVFVLRVIPKGTSSSTKKFDVLGAILLFVCMVSGTFALERFAHVDIADPQMLVSLALCAVTGAGFVITELKNTSPLLNIRVFRRFNITAVFAAYLLIQIIYSGILYISPFYFTGVAGMDSLTAGMWLLIPPVITVLISVPIGRWSDKTQRRSFCVISGVMLTLSCLIFGIIQPEWGWLAIVTACVSVGICIGLSSGPGSSKCIELMPENEKESGSTLVMTIVYVGAVVGVALFAGIFTVFTKAGNAVLSFSDLPHDVFLSGFHITMLIAAVLSVLVVVFMAIVKDAPREK